MLFNKLFAGSVIISNSIFLKTQSKIRSECAENKTEQQVQDLDKIFAQNDGLPPDQDEMMEMLMKAQGKNIRKPLQFQRLLMGLKMLTMVEPIDGIKFDFMAPLSQKFQLGGSWVFSNTKANKFELSTALTSASGNNPMAQDEMSFVSTRSDSTGKLEYNGTLNLGQGFSLRSEGFFMDSDFQKSHLAVELMKEFNDSHFAFKMGGGSYNFSYMQTLSKQLMSGFEMYYIPHQRDVHFCYGLNFNYDDIHSFYWQYIPIARKETFQFGYVGKPSKRLTLFSELKGSLESFSDTLFGFRVRFMEGMVTGTFSSSMKATSTYRHFIEGILMIQFTSSIDFMKPEKPATFGVGLSIGGM